jgi:hypothetical protein
MLPEGQCPIKKEAQVAPHHLRPKSLFPHVRSHGERDSRRMATPLSRKVEKLGLGVLHRESEVPESIKHDPIHLRKAWDVTIKGFGLANNGAIIHIR